MFGSVTMGNIFFFNALSPPSQLWLQHSIINIIITIITSTITRSYQPPIPSPASSLLLPPLSLLPTSSSSPSPPSSRSSSSLSPLFPPPKQNACSGDEHLHTEIQHISNNNLNVCCYGHLFHTYYIAEMYLCHAFSQRKS